MYHVPYINQMYTFFKKTDKYVGGYSVIRLLSYAQVHLLVFLKILYHISYLYLNSIDPD